MYNWSAQVFPHRLQKKPRDKMLIYILAKVCIFLEVAIINIDWQTSIILQSDKNIFVIKTSMFIYKLSKN